MLGSYYQTRTLQAVGSDTDPEGQKEASRALLEIFPNLPANRYTLWGRQVGEGQWVETASEKDYLAASVTPEQLVRAEELAGGHAVGRVAIITTKPLPLLAAEQVFSGSPFEAEKAEVTYWQSDRSEQPTPVYFLWGRLRDQSERPGTYEMLARRAKIVDGTLAFVFSVPQLLTPRPRPLYRLDSVLGHGGPEIRSTAERRREAESAPEWLPMGDAEPKETFGKYVAVGALAAVGAYFLFKKRRK